MIDYSKLEEMEEDIYTCTRCPLFQKRNKPIAGWYPNTAKDLLFIADGPHPVDDISGYPLIGKAGTHFNDAVYDIFGLERKDYFILFCVKCIPIHNKVRTWPEKNELFWCSYYLFKQIEILNPKLIISLGLPAFNTLIYKVGSIFRDIHNISPYTGYLYKTKDIFNESVTWPTIPTYDPTGWLRSNDNFETALKDLKKAKVIFDAINSGQSIEDFYRSSPTLQQNTKRGRPRSKLPT